MKESINCCHCKQSFAIADAEMCGGCNPCDACRGARSIDEGCYFGNCGTHTLACTHCGHCACDKIEQWKTENKIVYMDAHHPGRFGWVHRDLLTA